MSHQQRPLSPHLQVYKPQISSVLSIFHRLSGVYLSLGGYVLALWLGFLAFCPDGFVSLSALLGTFLGKVLLMGWTVAFFYHFSNGIRHLFWDAGKGYELDTMAKSGWAVLAISLTMALGVWLWIFLRWGF